MLERCSPQQQALLRRVLAHSEKTSRQWYARPDLTSTGIQAVHIIQKLLDVDEKEDKKEEDDEETTKPQKDSPAASSQPDAKCSAEPPASGPGELEKLEEQSTPPPPAIVEGLPKHDSLPVFAASTSLPPPAILQDASSAPPSASNSRGAAAATSYETQSVLPECQANNQPLSVA